MGRAGIQGTYLAFSAEAGGGESPRKSGRGRLVEKRWPEGTPWMKAEQWKMGTPPNSAEDEVIPAEANPNSPLGGQKMVLLGQKLWRCLAPAKKGGEASSGPKATSPKGPTLARKRD